MNKYIASFASKPFTDFVDKVSARWQLLTQPNTPSKVEEGESAESILADLIAIPTTTGNHEAIHESLDYIEEFLQRRGMIVKRLEWNGVESLVATTRPTKTPTVFLAAHIDVVPAPTHLFELRTTKDRLYGRGTLDMKFAIAAYLAAVDRLPGELKDYDFGIMIMSDEEVGGFDGAQKLAESGYMPKVMVLPDGGSNWNLERSAKAIWWITLSATGQAAHSSRPWEGQNAISQLMAGLQEIRALFPEQQTADDNTINIGMIQGGKVFNQIPASANASIDMRLVGNAEYLKIRDAITSIVERLGLALTTEIFTDGINNDPQNPYLQAYISCTEAIIDRKLEWISSNAGSDARFFTKHGVACAVAYPPGANHHGAEEYIEREAFAQFNALIAAYLKQVARPGAGDND